MTIDDWNPPSSAVPIWPGAPPGFQAAFGQPIPTLTPFLARPSGKPSAVIMLPGGGYMMKAAHEGEPIARWLNSLGISAFVLDYRVAPYRHPVPLLDARRAVQFVRARSAEWNTDAARVAVLGFSAGGHLASTLGTHFEALSAETNDETSRQNFRPDALILCYPVISFGQYRHHGSMENLLGSNPSDELRQSLSNELQVSKDSPPAFVWYTASDASVPAENSLLFAGALSACRVSFELHVYASGEHGLGLAEGHPSAAPWPDQCARWLHNQGF